MGINRRKITHTSTSRWAMPMRSSVPTALRYSASIRAWAHTKLIRQIVLTVTGTELKSATLLPSSCRPQPTSARRHRPAVPGRFTMATNDPNSAGCKRHDGRTSDSGCARASHRSHRGSPMGLIGDPRPLPRGATARKIETLLGYTEACPSQEGKGPGRSDQGRSASTDSSPSSERAEIAAAITLSRSGSAGARTHRRRTGSGRDQRGCRRL